MYTGWTVAKGMTHGSLFSGIGGFDLAAEWMEWTNVFHCEINEYCNKILNQHFPHAKSYADITTTDFSEWKGRCDIITGGFPCQPYSQAGKRKGKQDDRHLWPEMLRAIGEIQPAWIVGENVPGLLNWERGVVLAEIKTDLEAQGFEVFTPLVLPACGKNAPHRRDRLWIIAYAAGNTGNNGIGNEGQNAQSLSEKRFNEFIVVANSSAPGLQITSWTKQQFISGKTKSFKGSEPGGTFTEANGWRNFPTQSPVCGGDDGVSNRVDRIKALGNAIVPQIAFEIFKVIEQINQWQKV